ncbi:MAG TPA: DEAD/DEAH box helicase family protein [Chloroflexota bacterium]|nr:DEAD/DEAH box helicase family protein [Chloroflexota bacterium]
MLAPEVRATLTAWLKAYGEANNLPGLATGPIEARFHRLREHAEADEMIIWTTPERRAAGAGPHIRIPALQLDLACRFHDGHIWADGMSPVPPGAREPQRERGSVGIDMSVERVELPVEADRPDPLAVEIEGIFDRLTGNRWRGFIAPLREALEAEARDDAERAERLAAPYERAEPRIGGRGQESPWRLLGLQASAVAAFDEGEWLDLLNARGVPIATARLVNADVGGGALDVDARGADPPQPGIVRPRPRTKILTQKRAILDELESPRGNLPLVARLMASPAAMPIPRPLYPQTFLNPNVGRSRSQARAVALALGLAEGEALLIEGPPGTGKSTTTGEMVAQILTRDPRARILVCSHSNHGTDNMLMKCVPYVDKVPGMDLARVGMFERVPADLRRFFVGPDEDLSDRNVIFTTIDALALNDAAGGSVYDYVVLDEANRATVLDSLIVLARGKRFILVGDRLQLQPVLSEAEEQLRLEPALARAGVIGKSLFVWLTERHFPDRAVVFLDEQNRMHPTIGGLIARAFYEDKLRNGPAAPRKETGVPFFSQPAVWVDTRGLRGLRESRNRGPSLFNLPEARLVTTITRHLLRAAPEDMDVGVIAAYAEQAAVLRRMLRGEQRTPGRKLEIDTVDAFEGREKDIVVVSLVRSNKRREIGFLQLMQRINVALSRSRRLLIIVGDTATLRGSYFDKILRYLRERGAVTPGPRVIAQLRGKAPETEPRAAGEGATPGEGRASRRRGRRQRARERRRELLAQTNGAGVVAEETLPEGLEVVDLVELDPELARELASIPTESERRPQRQRRSPAEILARLNQQIGVEPDQTPAPAPTPPSQPPTPAEASTAEPATSGSPVGDGQGEGIGPGAPLEPTAAAAAPPSRRRSRVKKAAPTEPPDAAPAAEAAPVPASAEPPASMPADAPTPEPAAAALAPPRTRTRRTRARAAAATAPTEPTVTAAPSANPGEESSAPGLPPTGAKGESIPAATQPPDTRAAEPPAAAAESTPPAEAAAPVERPPTAEPVPSAEAAPPADAAPPAEPARPAPKRRSGSIRNRAKVPPLTLGLSLEALAAPAVAEAALANANGGPPAEPPAASEPEPKPRRPRRSRANPATAAE